MTVVENDPQALEAMRALNVNTVEADLDQNQWLADLAGIQFDAVLACDVLEHLRDPQRLLHALSSVLKPQGRIVISVPNIAYAGVVAALRNGVFDYVDKGILNHAHMCAFSHSARCTPCCLTVAGHPNFWDAHRVPIAASELAWCWGELNAAKGAKYCNQVGPNLMFTNGWWSPSLQLLMPMRGRPNSALAITMCDELYALKHVHPRTCIFARAPGEAFQKPKL